MKSHEPRKNFSEVNSSTSSTYSKKIISLLKKEFPTAHCELDYDGAFQLLVATILSAQCTDIQVNKVTPKLFQECPTPETLSVKPLPQIESLIHSIGLYRNKAKNLKLMSQMIMDNFSGVVPQTMEQLIKLPGVGRKTANVVLGNAFGLSEGVVVDTHVSRITQRLGLTQKTTPELIEKDLMLLFPQKSWTEISHLFIFLGRRTCKARSPLCSECCLKKICPSCSLLIVS